MRRLCILSFLFINFFIAQLCFSGEVNIDIKSKNTKTSTISLQTTLAKKSATKAEADLADIQVVFTTGTAFLAHIATYNSETHTSTESDHSYGVGQV